MYNQSALCMYRYSFKEKRDIKSGTERVSASGLTQHWP